MKILNFGSLNVDYVYEVDHFVRGGETISSRNLSLYAGGKGLNQSVALARAGSMVYHAGIVGQDGDMLLDMLSKSSVQTDFVKKDQAAISGHALIQVDKQGQNCILLYGGTNQMLTRPWIDQVLGSFGEGDWLVLQNEVNELAYIMEKAKSQGLKIVLNPSPMDEKIAGLPLELVDLFMLNEIEAAGILGDQKEMSPKAALDLLQQRYPKSAIVLTLGSAGAVYRGPEGEFSHGIYKVPVVDTTAAGDTFTGYFVTEIARGVDPKRALATASVASSIAVSRKGAAPSIPTLTEVKESALVEM